MYQSSHHPNSSSSNIPTLCGTGRHFIEVHSLIIMFCQSLLVGTWILNIHILEREKKVGFFFLNVFNYIYTYINLLDFFLTNIYKKDFFNKVSSSPA